MEYYKIHATIEDNTATAPRLHTLQARYVLFHKTEETKKNITTCIHNTPPHQVKNNPHTENHTSSICKQTVHIYNQITYTQLIWPFIFTSLQENHQSQWSHSSFPISSNGTYWAIKLKQRNTHRGNLRAHVFNGDRKRMDCLLSCK